MLYESKQKIERTITSMLEDLVLCHVLLLKSCADPIKDPLFFRCCIYISISILYAGRTSAAISVNITNLQFSSKQLITLPQVGTLKCCN